jgi:hypothetical protein
MKKVVIGAVVVVGVALLIVGCSNKRPKGSEGMTTTSQAVVAPSPKIDSPESALRCAAEFLVQQRVDTSGFDMSKDGTVRRMELHGRPAWRVEWKLKGIGSSRDTVTKGGELLVLVTDEGKCQRAGGQ